MEIDKLYEKITLISSLLILSNLTFIAFGFPLLILKVNLPSNDEISYIKSKSILIGQFDIFSNKELINKLIRKNIKIFSLTLLPRITRAQSMDILSSQANLAGYKAVIEAF